MHLLKNLGKYSNYGTLILRLIVGIVFIVHGYLKLIDLGGTAGFFGNLGIPAAGFFAILVALVEFLGGIGYVAGLFTRYAGLLTGIDMLVALILVHARNGFLIASGGYEGGGYKFVLTLLGISIFFLFHGAGKYSLDEKFFEKSKR